MYACFFALVPTAYNPTVKLTVVFQIAYAMYLESCPLIGQLAMA